MAQLKVSDRVGELGTELGTLAGDLGGYLREQRESARLSLRQLATVAGVSNPYLSQIERGLRKPSAEVLQQLAKGLQISAEALFLRAGLLEESEGVQVEVAVQSDLQLTARQKRVLLDIYATFRAENARDVAPEPAPEPAEPARAPRKVAATTRKTATKRATKKATKQAAKATTKTAAKAPTARKRAAKAATPTRPDQRDRA